MASFISITSLIKRITSMIQVQTYIFYFALFKCNHTVIPICIVATIKDHETYMNFEACYQ